MMPLYVYSCPKCKRQIEIEQKISNRRNPLCTEEGCDGNIEMEAVIQAGTFVLRGSGWARDGYAGSGKK